MIQFETVRLVQVETMAKLSISEAIKQSGVARSTFYKKYVHQGLITVSVDNNKKYIDSSELVRVFPSLKVETAKNTKSNTITQSVETRSDSIEHSENTQLKIEVKLLREALEKTEQDKEWLKEQNTTLLLRLEAPKHINPIIKWWRGLK
jgi:hypothetical protein